MRHFLSIVLVLVVTTLLVHVRGQGTRSPSPLSLAQLERLITVAPDAALAGEVKSRGISFTADDVTLRRLFELGAGPLAMSAIHEFRLRGVLIVQGEPGAGVFIDGTLRGQTAADGRLHVTLVAGEYTVRLSKTRYSDGIAHVAIAAAEETRAMIPMALTVGILDITTNRPSASIEIEGVGTFVGTAQAEGAAGPHAVTVSGQHLLTVRDTATIVAGETTGRRIDVPMDPAFRKSMLGAADDALRRHTWNEADRFAREVLDVDPDEGGALMVLAQTSMATARLGDYERHAQRGIANGGVATCEFMHHHSRREMVHRARVWFSAGDFAFDPQVDGSNCTYKSFRVPVSLVTSVQIVGPDQANGMLEIRLRRKGGGTDSFKFGHADSYWTEVRTTSSRKLLGGFGGTLTSTGTTNLLRSSSSGLQQLVAIHHVLQAAAGGRLAVQ